MKTLIIYTSRHGATQKVVEHIKSHLQGETQLFLLKDFCDINLLSFDSIIIATSIHMGQIPGEVSKFCSLFSSILLEKRLGLVLCCLSEGKKAFDQYRNVFSQELRSHASASLIAGGEFDLESMNQFERILVKKVVTASESYSSLKLNDVETFVDELAVPDLV